MYFILMVSEIETKEFSRYIIHENDLGQVLNNFNKQKYQVEDITCLGLVSLDYKEIININKDIEHG